jgi:hypothetical protein
MSEISSNEKNEDLERIDRHVFQLSEHYDTVHIFVTRNDGDKDQTRCANRGSGNWCARFGQISEWVIYENERIRQAARPNQES